MKHKKSVIFIIISIVFLLTLIGIYGYRLLYYYKIENPKKLDNLLLHEIITLDSNIVIKNDGLYKENNGYIFKGKNVNNYLFYNGIMWRIISIDLNGNIKLISDSSLTSLVWGYKTNKFSDSYIYDWLNKSNEENSGIFESLLNTNKLIKSSYCTDSYTKDNYDECKSKNDYLIGLLSLNEYEEAKGINSYLSNKEYYWTINGSDDNKAWYIDVDGKINNNSYNGDVYQIYGVRPTITLKSNLKLISGNGSLLTPYKIENNKPNTLNDVTIGTYITYNDYTFKVIDKDTKKIKIVMDGFIKNDNKDIELPFSEDEFEYNSNNNTNIAHYLNNEFYNILKNKDYLVKGDWYIGEYGFQNEYDYKQIYANSVREYIGLVNIADIFIHDHINYFTLTPSNSYVETIYKVSENGLLYGDLISENNRVRPSLYLKSSLKIVDGIGEKQNPYKISNK